ECGQAGPRATERIGLENLGAGFDVLLVDAANQVWRREIELIEAAVDEDAARIEHGAHGAIGHHHTAGETFTKLLSAADGNGIHGRSGAELPYALILAAVARRGFAGSTLPLRR